MLWHSKMMKDASCFQLTKNSEKNGKGHWKPQTSLRKKSRLESYGQQLLLNWILVWSKLKQVEDYIHVGVAGAWQHQVQLVKELPSVESETRLSEDDRNLSIPVINGLLWRDNRGWRISKREQKQKKNALKGLQPYLMQLSPSVPWEIKHWCAQRSVGASTQKSLDVETQVEELVSPLEA